MNAEKLYFAAKEIQNELLKFDIKAPIREIIQFLEKFNRSFIRNHDTKEVKEQVNGILANINVYFDLLGDKYQEKYLMDALKEISALDYFGTSLKKKIFETTLKTIEYAAITYSKFDTYELNELVMKIKYIEMIISGIVSGLSFYENQKENASNSL